MKLISIVVPIHNEAANIPVLHKQVSDMFSHILTNHNLELIFVDDGSIDNSVNVIQDLMRTDSRVRLLQFTRNFGKELATTAGIHASKGDAVLMMDADLQHPVRMIPEFIRQWEEGSEIVIGVRVANQKEGFIKKWGSVLFYKLLSLISDTKIIKDATDFRIMDRAVVNEFNKFSERSRITRGLIDWLGFDPSFIYFKADARKRGHAAYSTIKLVRLAFSSFVAHSTFPLKLAGYLGILIVFTSGPLGIFILIEKYLLDDPWGLNITGPATLGVVTLFLIGIVLACLGLIALYIANIHTEVTNRPMYVIKRNLKRVLPEKSEVRTAEKGMRTEEGTGLGTENVEQI